MLYPLPLMEHPSLCHTHTKLSHAVSQQATGVKNDKKD